MDASSSMQETVRIGTLSFHAPTSKDKIEKMLSLPKSETPLFSNFYHLYTAYFLMVNLGQFIS